MAGAAAATGAVTTTGSATSSAVDGSDMRSADDGMVCMGVVKAEADAKRERAIAIFMVFVVGCFVGVLLYEDRDGCTESRPSALATSLL
jgi:hypothetical protein